MSSDALAEGPQSRRVGKVLGSARRVQFKMGHLRVNLWVNGQTARKKEITEVLKFIASNLH